MAIKLLIGGSPCTYWSIAQSPDKREVVADGIGWELFKNYLIAKEKFKPDFFLYENNKSAAQPIKDQISRELGVDLMYIDSALVSAQNRQRFYAFNWNVDLPTDRGIMLKDILETTTSEKGYALRVPAVGVGCRNGREDDGKLYRRFETSGIPKANALTTVQTDSMVAEFIAINTTVDGKAQCIRASCYKDGIRKLVGNTIDRRTCVAIPVMPVKEATKKGFAEIEAGDCVDMTQPNSKTRRGRNMKDKCNCLMTGNQYYRYLGTVNQPIYEVENGRITIKGKKYPIRLVDGLMRCWGV